MHDPESRRRSNGFRLAVAVAVALVLAAVGGAYLIHVGDTDSWPQTDCTVAGTRVVRSDVADSFRAIVMYRGEYRLRYVVEGQDYYVWANAGWSDPDRQFVQDKVDARTDRCDFRVRYNPTHPADAIAVQK
jgi:hypothetical protein